MTDLLADYDQRCAGGSDIVGHLPYLFERATHSGVLVELGVRSGESTCAFLAGIERSGLGHLWSVDTDAPSVPPEWHWDDRWTFIQGNDLEVADELPDVIDLLFIDTSHQYRHTWDELDLYGPMVVDGGVILLHDTDLEVAPGSVRDEDKGYPVRRAVQEWCEAQGLSPEFREGWHGLGVIEVTRG
jgi:predicted O-methyltransferase YrrM